MSWEWREEYLDQILVPIGLFIMISYHFFLWYTYQKFPLTTEMGCEDHYKRTWVEKTLQLQPKDVGPPAAVINSNIIASTSMASVSLVLSSLLGAWIGISSSETNNVLSRRVIYGDTRATTTSIKYIALLLCFLAAFAAFVQTTRNYTLAAFLISMPTSGIHVSYIQKPIIRGGNFWAIGIRALHFAAILIMWIFGPIPMFVSAVIMVAVLYNVDITSTPPYQFQPHLRHHQLYSPKNDEELE